MIPAPVLFVTRDGDPDAADWLDALRAAMPDITLMSFAEAPAEARQHCEVAVVAVADTDKLAQLPALRWVQSLWAGVESLLACPALDDVAIVRLIDEGLSTTMAEAALAWTLYLHRDMPAYRAAQQRREWAPRPYTPAADKTVGVLGCGELGCAALARLHEAGFRTCGWSRSPKTLPHATHFAGAAALPAMLAQCDILISLLPNTRETDRLLNKVTLASLPTGAGLINFGRANVIDDKALLDALDSGQIGHAVLDVFREEPLPPTSAYWTHPAVTVLPHISAPTPLGTAARRAANNVTQFLQHGTLPNSVDRQRGY